MVTLTKSAKAQMIFALTALMLLSASSTDIYISSLPAMVREFNTTSSMVNLTLSSYNFGIALGVLVVGELSNRFGRRVCLLYGVTCFALASFLIALIPSIHIMILLRFIQSIGAATVIIAPRLILKDCMTEHEQIRANGILLMGFMISPALAPVLGAYLAKFFGWKSCFYFSGFFASLMWFYCWKTLPETNANCIGKFAKFSIYVQSYTNILKNRVFWGLTGIYSGAVYLLWVIAF